jgi:hypothetical protein
MKDDEKFRYYIKKAGGVASKADTRGTLIIRASSGQKVAAGGQEVLPGDIIWVPTVPERDWWEITKDVLTIVAQVATIWLVVDGTTGK